MKITNNFNIPQNNKITSKCFADRTSNKEQAQPQNTAKCSPLLYQAYNNISFGSSADDIKYISSTVKDKDGYEVIKVCCPTKKGAIKFTIDDMTVDVFLRNKNREINEDALRTYIFLYKSKYEEEVAKTQEISDYLKEELKTVNKESNIRSIKPEEDIKRATIRNLNKENTFEILKGILAEIPDGYDKYCKIKDIIQIYQDKSFNFHSNAKSYATAMMGLVQKSSGEFDLTNLEKMSQFEEQLFGISTNYSNELAESIIQESKDLDGNIDADFGIKLCNLINLNGCLDDNNVEAEVAYAADLLNTILKSIDGNEEKVMHAVKTLICDGEIIDRRDGIFKRTFNYCLNSITDKYSDERFQAVLSLSVNFDEWLGTQMNDIDFLEDYPKYNELKQNYIARYFAENQDYSTGELKPGAMDIDEYSKQLYEESK